MANIITELRAKLVQDRGANKTFPCKTYATESAAERATLAAAIEVADEFDSDENAPPAGYLVVYVPEFDRWVGVLHITEVIRRPTSTGGYAGVAPGFYKF